MFGGANRKTPDEMIQQTHRAIGCADSPGYPAEEKACS